MKHLLIASAALIALSTTAQAEGDIAAGEKAFKKCKACHMVVSPDGEEIFKGGKTGPNLYGVVGRVAGSVDGFKYGNGLQDANGASFVWTMEEIATYVVNPKAWLGEQGFAPKSKMTYKLKKGGEDVAAWLASVAPAPEETTTEDEPPKSE